MQADGRELHLGMVYACLLGSRMLGSTMFPWLIGGSSLRTEDCLVYTFIISGSVSFVVAYDYQVCQIDPCVCQLWIRSNEFWLLSLSILQEVGTLVSLFCLFHVCVGIIIPSLARLRTMWVNYCSLYSLFFSGVMCFCNVKLTCCTVYYISQICTKWTSSRDDEPFSCPCKWCSRITCAASEYFGTLMYFLHAFIDCCRNTKKEATN